MGLINSDLPPPRYDYPPHMKVIERRISYAELQQMCGPVPMGAVVMGCTFTSNRTCFVHLAPGADQRVRRHELAHCNGWNATHDN
jgi:hypothetical protein